MLTAEIQIPPGLLGLRNKKTKDVSVHFPVDVREILAVNKDQYEIVDNGAAEAARLSMAPLIEMQQSSDSLGTDGKIMVPMSPEDQAAFKAFLAAQASPAPAPTPVPAAKGKDEKVETPK